MMRASSWVSLLVDAPCFTQTGTSWIGMLYANGGGRSVTLPVFDCLPLAATLGWLMCLCIHAPPPYYVVCPPFGISIGVCLCMSVLVPAPPLTLSFYAGLCVFVSCYSISFLSRCTLFPVLKVDKWDSLCCFLQALSPSLSPCFIASSLSLSPFLHPPSPLCSLSHPLSPLSLLPSPLPRVSIGHNEVIGMCRVGSEAEGPGREHWVAMLANPRKPIEHWHQLVEVMRIWSCVFMCVWPWMSASMSVTSYHICYAHFCCSFWSQITKMNWLYYHSK